MAVLIVTGARTGIGAATARLAGERGYAVALNYLRGQNPAEETVAAIRDAGGHAIAIQADVSSEADVCKSV
jgi:NAD(P)-dependent dehydrogenase (short-subunit alcohol dehydrogenase family)